MSSSYKICHVSDIHIRKLKYHTEYREVFEQLYDSLRAEKPDIILNTGDTFHTKTDLSSEAVQMMSELFSNLADIAPFHMILGNHDMNLRSLGRLDAISPIVNNLDHPDIHFHKLSTVVSLTDDIDMHVLSIVDPDNWQEEIDDSKTSIAVYHGAVKGVKTDMGWVMEHGDIDVSTLNKYDYAMLGDIHKTNQMIGANPKFRYPGSLIQQNHGETNDKGYLTWEISGKDSYEIRHTSLQNPRAFVTVELTKKGRMPRNATVPAGARLRLVSNNNLSLDKMRRAVDIAKHRFKPESITFLNRALGSQSGSDVNPDDFIKENLRDISVQKRMIQDFLEEYEIEDEVLERVLELNSKYNTAVENNEEVARNINWKLNSFEWDSLFNYGESNSIDFTNISGIVGIFGKNYSGKSSIIDAALYTLFNSTSKNERKNLNIINQNKDRGQGRIGISIGDRQFVVERSSEKYTKRLKGEETLEAKTNVDFLEINALGDEVVSHNGMTRADTDKNIRKMFGTLDDFLLTSMASQLDSLTFIKEGSTRRKEILAKFLDLEIFDKKYKMAKEDASDLRGALKRLEGKEFEGDIEQAMRDTMQSSIDIQENEKKCQEYNQQLIDIAAFLSEVEGKIASIPLKVIDIEAESALLSSKRGDILSLTEENKEIRKQNKSNETLIRKLSNFLSDYDIENLRNKKKEVSDKNDKYSELTSLLREKKRDVEDNEKRVKLLEEVPCGDQFSSCKFICNAHKANLELPDMLSEVNAIQQQGVKILKDINSLDSKKLDDYLDKYDALVDRRTQVEQEMSVSELELANNLTRLEVFKHEIEGIVESIKVYEDNRDAIENLEQLVSKRNEHAALLSRTEKNCKQCKQDLNDLYVSHGSYENKLQNLMDQKSELSDLREDYSAYDLYMKCMHSSGISYDIIKKKLPAINEEIAKVLTNIVNFEVFFENDGRRLNVYIRHPKHDPRPIEMGSGAEKTIASMAIRLSLLHVSNLPKPNIFVMDEPGTALDAENLEGFVRILEMVKSYFKTVILISHLDSLKDCVDVVINVDKKDGFAYVSQ